MIAYLQGKIRAKMEKSIILDTGNIGYLVHVPVRLLETMEKKGDIELYIYTKVREDDISLFGFESMTELNFFKTLLGINGVGPKLALEILSQNIEKVKSAIVSGETAYLSKIPGIGKKTAERMIVELKNKVDWDITVSHEHGNMDHEIGDDVVNALMSLGYQRFEIRRILKDMPENITKVEDIVPYFLRNV